MSLFKKIMVVVASASFFALCGCKVTETETKYLDVKVSQVNATIGGNTFNQYAVAKVSDDSASTNQDTKVTGLFGSDGTMIYSTNSETKERLFVTYKGKTAGTYKTGTATAETVTNKLLDYLVSGSGTLSTEDIVSVKSNVTYFDGTDYWYSTFCTVTVSGQTNGNTLSLINGSFECDVYKKGDSAQKKAIKGTIHNVVGIQ